ALRKSIERTGNRYNRGARARGRERRVDLVAAHIKRTQRHAGRDRPAGPPRGKRSACPRHRDKLGLALRLGERTAAFGATGDVIVDQEAPGIRESASEVVAEGGPELGASQGCGAGYLVP